MKLHKLAIVGGLYALSPIVYCSQTINVSNEIHLGNSVAQFVSGASGLDAPKMDPEINATSFDWWYFDAVSNNNSCAIVIVFYMTTDLGFPFVLPLSTLSVDIFATFEDGTLVFLPLNDQPLSAGTATVVTDGDGSSGIWDGTGFQWKGAPDLSQYVVTIDSPLLGVTGTLVLNSVAPAHYPCGPNKAGQNLEVSPHVGWANAVPDANAIADFTVLGRKLQFTGPGYHDKNWGDQPFTENVASWYWGHGRLGPYSIVWFDVLALDGSEYVSSYAAVNGSIITASCSGIKVRPTGKNSQYPPVITSGNPQGFHIDLDLGSEGILEVNVTSDVTLADAILYTRWSGTMSGGVKGGIVYTGVALYEEFKFQL